MEGYVEWYKRGRYQRYWTVLDGQQLSFYEKLDLQLQEAINIQVIYIRLPIGTYFRVFILYKMRL